MIENAYPCVRAAAFLKQQPVHNCLVFEYNGRRILLGINEEATAVLKACDGLSTSEDVYHSLAVKYHDNVDNVLGKVEPFLQDLERLNVIEYVSDPTSTPIRVIGSKEYITPDYVIIELTYRCPLRCIHCYVDAGHGPVMEFPKLQDLLTELVDQIGVNGVQLTGGEPLLYPHINAVVDYLSGKGIPIYIATSGMVLNSSTKEVLEKLRNRRGSIQVSFDGFETTHNRIRGNPHSFQNAMTFLNYVIDHEIAADTATSLIDQSEDEVIALCVRMRDLGVRRFRLGAVSMQGRGATLDPATLWSAQRVRTLRAQLQRDYATESFQVDTTDDARSEHQSVNCGAGTRLLAVDPVFRVRPCALTSLCLGDLKQECLNSVILRGNTLLGNMAAPDNVICSGCPFEINCQGCIAEGYTNSHKVESCIWFTQEQARLRPLMGVTPV